MDTNSLNCNHSEFSEKQKIVLISITAVVAGTSFFCCLGVILLIILFKKYMFFTQRMILYLDIAAMLSSLARTTNLSIHSIESGISSNSVAEKYCEATGFLDQYMSSCFLIAIAAFTIDIFLQATFSIQTKKGEVLYPLLIFSLPALYCWVPFVFDAYGEAGPWCWIVMQEVSSKGCKDVPAGRYLQFALYYIPYSLLFLVLFVLVVIMLVVLYRRRHDYGATVNPLTTRMRTALRNEIKTLLLYPIVIILLNIIPFATRVHGVLSDSHGTYVFILWVVNSMVAPLEGAVIALIFTLDPETRKRLTITQIRAAILNICSHSHGAVSEYPAETVKVSTDSYNKNTLSQSKQPLLDKHHSYDSTM